MQFAMNNSLLQTGSSRPTAITRSGFFLEFAIEYAHVLGDCLGSQNAFAQGDLPSTHEQSTN